MVKRIVLPVLIAAALLTLSRVALLAQEVGVPLKLEIVPNERHEAQAYVRYNKPGDASAHFHVLLSNVSKEAQTLFDDASSSDSGRLCFEVTDAQGKVSRVQKKGAAAAGGQGADWFLLQPGERVIYDVYFDDATWDNVPHSAQTGGGLAIRAVYSLGGSTIASPQYLLFTSNN